MLMPRQLQLFCAVDCMLGEVANYGGLLELVGGMVEDRKDRKP